MNFHPPSQLIDLSREIGQPGLGLAILAEGNTSTNIGCEMGQFWVKSSGMNLGSATSDSFSLVEAASLYSAVESLDKRFIADAEIKDLLAKSKLAPENLSRPSVETFMHAWLLALPNIHWVIHTHPEPVLSLVCLHGAEKWALEPLFPDEIVCCGPQICFVPYADPGLPLARMIALKTQEFLPTHGEFPKTFWLQNHGLVTIGKSMEDAKSATFMAVKAAKIRLSALQTSQPMIHLNSETVNRIHTRPDEHYRRSLLENGDKIK